ncbi:hypothetical protein MPLDJ20_70167 [Mesorhizobium plurifarium]|uniref:Uncharacterized protein n=1 Tax=Mesorhizobium plurifarium TaxID=69974 RepID=A0A090FNI5_MESPL|nr:hypothetical protein MPLDJ20_70167 [Mesorhizobium plurifarium]
MVAPLLPADRTEIALGKSGFSFDQPCHWHLLICSALQAGLREPGRLTHSAFDICS